MADEETTPVAAKKTVAKAPKTPVVVQYKVNKGITYDGKFAEANDVVSDIPKAAAKWLLDQGYIEEVD